ncbi:Rpn family recombination-promoting nuclease/putative transposase [Thiomicrospira microaerophila]|uniref:Rpn family recombination-promoting nuclease/putative transposase n=1 Tax=Thiomicrospira microaerophila TaxID=406020 RepID=UPI0005C97C72|nr:Rpn family recombination-promoting nuclease/putative transposase [Thiomicrospira microaerophila]
MTQHQNEMPENDDDWLYGDSTEHSHDRGYKFLFSHKELVQELIEGFAPAELVTNLDFSLLQKENGSFITPAMKKRDSDVVWSAKLKGSEQDVYLYLMLEFQSEVDLSMPVRMLQYVAALYDDLNKQNRLSFKKGLPPVFPVVLYNGQPKWTAKHQMADLFHNLPDYLKPYQPQLHYYLIDEERIPDNQIDNVINGISTIFSFEKAHEYAQARRSTQKLVGYLDSLGDDKRALAMAVLKWVMVHLKKNYPTINIAPVEHIIKEPSMLAQNVENWKREIYAEGEQLGKLEQAVQMIREFNLSVELVAERCHLSIKELKERLSQIEK